MKKQLLIAAFSFFGMQVQAQVFQAAYRFSSPDHDQSQAVATDASGNVYTAGIYRGYFDADPGAGVFNLPNSGGLAYDIFIIKMDAAGNFVWAKNVGGLSNDIVYSLALDPSGNVCFTGNFGGTVDFDPGPSAFNLVSYGATDIFACKLDANGNFVWAKQLGGTSDETGYGIKSDASGNFFLTGSFSGSADFNPGVGVNILYSAGDTDAFVVKLDPSGNYLWVNQFGGTGTDVGNAIEVDAVNTVYVTGSFNGSVDFDPGAGTNVFTSLGSSDVFITKLDNSGNYSWTQVIGGTLYDNARGIAIDDNNDLYITGAYYNTVDFDPGAAVANLTVVGGGSTSDIFVLKLDESGNYLWAKSFGSNGNDQGQAICNDVSGNVLITGDFAYTVDFDPGPATYNIVGGLRDLFIEKLTAEGDFVSAKKIASNGDDYAYGIAGDDFGNVYTVGLFWLTADFNTEAGVYTLTSAGTKDAFLHKMSCTSSYSSLSVSECYAYTWGQDTYTASGAYTKTVSNAIGCDSIITLNLTILESTTASINASSCDSYTSPSGQTWTSSGTYNDTIPNTAGCDSILTINLTINTVDPSATLASGTITASQSNASYQWVSCPSLSPISGETSQTFTPTANGDYAVIVNNNGCIDTSACITITGVGLNELAVNDLLTIFPNPTSDQLHISAVRSFNNWVIADVSGRIIATQPISVTETTDIPVQSLENGVYWIELRLGTESLARKRFLVQHH